MTILARLNEAGKIIACLDYLFTERCEGQSFLVTKGPTIPPNMVL